MKIRQFEEKDREQIRQICFDTCGDENLKKMPEVLFSCYADYYMNEEQEHTFVAVDDCDKVIGYILCSPNYKKYVKLQKTKYLPALLPLDKSFYEIRKKTLKYDTIMGVKYPAHLHIDLSPSCQRQGIGHLLMDALLDKLTVEKVKGVWLGCYALNEKGVNFYAKYGFKNPLTMGDTAVFTMKLKEYKNQK